MSWFERFTRLFGKKSLARPDGPAAGAPMLAPQDAQKVLGMLARTADKELTCDEVFALLDQFAEMAARGEDVAALMPMVKQHLDMCKDCREEYESLLNVISQRG